MIEFLIVIAYFLIYIVFFQLKSIRDYVALYNAGYPERWNTSIWKKLPDWFEGYLLDGAQMFIENNPPKLARWILWNKKKTNFRLGHLDGWHQSDGIIYMLPHSFIVILMGHYIFGWALFTSFLVSIGVAFLWYEFFNYVYHIQHRVIGRKEYDSVWWMKWLKK